MKILYLVHQFFPGSYYGTEKFVYNISSMMQKLGFEVKVITYSFYNNSFYDENIGNIFYREFTYKGIPVIAIRHKRILNHIDIDVVDKDMKEMSEYFLSKEKPDIVHVGHPMRVCEFIRTSLQFKIPYIITLTDFWFLCPRGILLNLNGDLCPGPQNGNLCKISCPRFPHTLIIKRIQFAKEILFNAKKVISPSMFLLKVFKKELEISNIIVIKYGTNLRKMKINNKSYKEGDKVVFAYTGSLKFHKGVHILINAFKMTESKNIILKIFGSGENPLYINKILSIAKSDKRIIFAGTYSQDEVGEVLSKVDVVVIPSIWYENFPFVLHEAVACNIPPVVSNVGALADEIKDGFNGFTFPVGDCKALKNIIEKIAKNPEILNEIKKNIEVFPLSTVEQEAFSYYKIYREIYQSKDGYNIQ